MFRYRLMTPPSSPFARFKKEIVVWLEAEYRDQSARLQFEGPTPLVAEVRRALGKAPGYRGREVDVDHTLTPLDLFEAMKSNVMRPFDPKLVEGEIVLTRPSPPTMTTEELTRSFANWFAIWLVSALPGPVKVRSYEWEHLVRALQGMLFDWSFWRPKHESREQAAGALAPLLGKALAHETTRLRDEYESRPVAQRLVPPSLTPEEAHEVASVFVEAFDTAAPGTDGAAALIVQLHEKLHALGLMSRRQA
ncbi:hypothetical protein [Myxococcus sp. Y35]|uniref:hypothetical protein n=1 Tax=Pseudomyxococcus flavus TaxID=3115648 RepID=UPI003CE8DEBF